MSVVAGGVGCILILVGVAGILAVTWIARDGVRRGVVAP